MKIILPKQVHQKIMYWVNKADFEVSGMGSIQWNKAMQAFVVHGACLIKQEGSAAATDINAEALSKAQFELREAPGQLSFWWHSHVDMDTFMSTTDVATCKELGQNGYCVAMVFNRKNKIKTAISYLSTASFGQAYTHYHEDVAFQILEPALDKDLVDALEKDFETNVTKKTYGAVRGASLHGDAEKVWVKGKVWCAETQKYIWPNQEKKEKGVEGKQESKGSSDKINSQLHLSSGSKKESYTGFDQDLFNQHWEEARALGLTYQAYKERLESGTLAELDNMDTKIQDYYKERYGE